MSSISEIEGLCASAVPK